MTAQVVFVDVDDTLVRSVGTKRIPMPATIAAVKRLHSSGAQLYLWSAGGAAYAQASAVELGIADCFAGFLPKPSVYIDDQSVAEWLQCQHVLPANANRLNGAD
jgi:cation transport ATPase